MKKIIKKFTAIIEIVALTITLTAGFGFVTARDVKAADGELTVNESVAISALGGESVSYTFTAPADDTYYFTTIGTDDTIGELYIDEEIVAFNDDPEFEYTNLNFLITYELKQGETCTIEVYGYVDEDMGEDGAINCDLIVYDTTTASSTVSSFGATELDGMYYCSPGEDVTFGIEVRSLSGEILNWEDTEYTVEWSRIAMNMGTFEEDVTILEGTENTYTVKNVASTDFYMQEEVIVAYTADIYLDGEIVGQVGFAIFDKEGFMNVEGGEHYVSVGDKVVLEPKAYDYDGNEIDLNNGEYTFEWYNTSEYETLGTDTTYTIDSVSEADFFDEEAYEPMYIVDIYKNDEFITYAEFVLYNKDEVEPPEPTTPVPTTPEPTTPVPTTPEPTTPAPTTVAPTTVTPTTVAPTTTAKEKVKKPAKAKIKKINSKKKAAKKVKLSLKNIKGAEGYLVAVYKTKNNAKKNKKAIVKKYVKKTNVIIKSKKLKNKKKLFVKARAYVLDGKKKVYGKWSNIKSVKIK